MKFYHIYITKLVFTFFFISTKVLEIPEGRGVIKNSLEGKILGGGDGVQIKSLPWKRRYGYFLDPHYYFYLLCWKLGFPLFKYTTGDNVKDEILTGYQGRVWPLGCG